MDHWYIEHLKRKNKILGIISISITSINFISIIIIFLDIYIFKFKILDYIDKFLY